MNSGIVGTTLAGFRVTDLLGKGGMGSVYKAHDPQLERDVALKLMDPVLAHDEAFMRRFRIEAKALAQLNNPHIVTVYALQETDQGVCIVMEFVQGTTLAEMIKTSGALEMKRALDLFRQILSAFEHAHKAGVLHRDIKPGNIMVTDSGEIRVTDFGLAKLHLGPSSTVTQLTGGTLYYVSPEQLEGLAGVDQRGDIYSIGMTLFEALTGTVPFEKTESDFRTRERIVKGKIQPPRSFNPSIPKHLSDFVMKAIARDPEDRFQSVEEMRVAFERIRADELQIAGGSKPGGSYGRVAAIALGVLALLVASFFMYRVFAPVQSDLSITTVPPDARVKVNGAEIGSSPFREYHVSSGPVLVRVEKENYAPIDTELSVESGQHLTITLRLIPTAVARKENPGPISNPAKETGQEAQPSANLATRETRKEATNIEKAVRREGSTRKPEQKREVASADRSKGQEQQSASEVASKEAEKLEAEKLEVEKLEKERLSAEEVAKAKKSLQDLVAQYTAAFEASNLSSLKSLLKFSSAEDQAWGKFFDVARNIKVNVNDLDVQNDAGKGDVAFKARLSYLNTSKGEEEHSTILNTWKCENVHGKWMIVSRK